MTCAIAVMAKAPKPGRCKTRLAPALTPDECALMSGAFLRDITENLAAASQFASIAPYIAYAPLGDEHLFDGVLAEGTRLVLADGKPEMPAGVQGFGKCLLHAIDSLLAAGYGAAGVLNSDSPTLPTSILAQAANLLNQPGDRAVFGPADDGGYYFLGVKSAHAHLFTDIAWSTETVAAQTIERARQIGLEMIMLPTWYDVDDPAALARLAESLERPDLVDGLLPYAAPSTAACVAQLGVRQRPRVAA